MSTTENSSKARLWLTHIAAFLLGSVVLFAVWTFMSQNAPCIKTYDLLNPSVRCGGIQGESEWDYEPLRDTLLSEIDGFTKSGSASNVSIYFRDLSHGPRFGIGEYDKFHPASLRKMPLMIAYLHLADLDKSILDKTLSYSGALAINQNVEPSEQTIKPDTLYTVRDLLSKMIIYSDNYSYTVLTNALNVTPPVIPWNTFHDLGVLKMMMDPNGDFISIQSYADLFAVLYNAGYLSKEMSQFGLNLLSQATFANGLVAGVPKGTIVAHKFGERFVPGEEGQLHDCGIVYHPKMAYVLCVMTTGTNETRQEGVVAQISRTVYDAISSLSVTGSGAMVHIAN